MAEYLDKEVIAEGIETSAQLKLLTELGCAFGQGFLFSKPASCSGARKLLEAEKAVEMKNQACDRDFLRCAHLE
jgi:EAL domain-containing protein (putative c-di-GMP-specific phosphodiesterase class I)